MRSGFTGFVALSDNAIKKTRWELNIALIGWLVLASLTTSSCGASDKLGVSKSVDANSSRLPELTKYARSYDWAETIPSTTPDVKCGQLLAELRRPVSIRWVKPRIESNSAADPSLGEVARCASYQSKARVDAPRPNNYIEGVADFGDGSFRLYRVKSGSRLQRYFDIVYGEFREDKIRTNAYFDAFTVINLSNCTLLGSIPVQRELTGDREVSAPREVVKGLFTYEGRVMVITVTEQIGHLQDPASFRAMAEWTLKDDGVFSQSCAWSPKGLVERTTAGERK